MEEEPNQELSAAEISLVPSPQGFEVERDELAFVRKLGALTLSEDTELFEHQVEAFEDIVSFFADGGRECYAKLPTGSGKTPLFIEIVKQLLSEVTTEDYRPRVLVLEPSKTLVDQTVGSTDPETGLRQGFEAFAPHLDARAIHSDINPDRRIINLAEADVVVTTYDTFRNISKQLGEATSRTAEEWRAEKVANIVGIAEAERDLDTAKLQRAAFLREKWTDQEVNRMRSDVDQLQSAADNGRLELSKSDVILMSGLRAILADTEATNSLILGRLVTFLRAQRPKRHQRPPNNIYGGIVAIRHAIEKRVETAAQTKRAAQELSGEPIIKPLRKPHLSEAEKDETAEETLRLVHLTEVELMMANFGWRHRPEKTISSYDIKGFDDKQDYRNMSANLIFGNDASKRLKKRNKHIEWMLSIQEVASSVELIVCDEVHHVMGKETWQAIRDFAKEKEIALLGLTATDETIEHSLEEFFEQMAHELTKQEAIRRQIINPVALYVHSTGLRFNDVSLDVAGDYDGLSLKAMRFSHERNQIGVSLVKRLIELGYHGISPCIPGDEGQHAKEIARMINETEVVDAVTGERRLAVARYILDRTPKDRRKEYYKDFERGPIDWLTSIDVLGEGWDSRSAKAMVAMRATRSPLVATQRLGRIGRTYPGAPISIAIDLFDGIISREGKTEIPPVLAADVLEIEAGPQGLVVGSKEKADQSVLDEISGLMPPGDVIPHHTKYMEALRTLPRVDALGLAKSRGTTAEKLDNPGDWQTLTALAKRYHGYLPEDTFDSRPEVRRARGRKGQYIVELINVMDAREYLESRPVVNPFKLFVDGDTRWISADGCIKMLSKAVPNATEERIDEAIRTYEVETGFSLKKNLVRKQMSFTGAPTQQYGMIYMYDLQEITDKLVPYLVK